MSDWPPPPASYPTYPAYPQAPRSGPSTSLLVIGAIGFFVAGAIASFALLVVIGLIVGDDTGSGRDGPADVTTYGPGGDLDAFALAPGQCGPAFLDEVAAIPEGTNVACNTEHRIEAYARLEPPEQAAGAAFQEDNLADFADSACYLAFLPYVGSSYDDSDFDYLPVMPSARAWNEQGARTISCVLFSYDGDTLEESARASNS